MKYDNDHNNEVSPPKMITISEVAQKLNVNANTIRLWSELGIIKSYRIGRNHHYMYRLDEIETFLDNDTSHQDQT